MSAERQTPRQRGYLRYLMREKRAPEDVWEQICADFGLNSVEDVWELDKKASSELIDILIHIPGEGARSPGESLRR